MPHPNHAIRWFRSMLAVLLPCLLLCSLLFGYVLYVLEKIVMETNTALNAYVQKSVDNRLEDLYRYSASIEITNDNILLKNMQEAPDSLPAQAYQLSDSLRDFSVTNKLVQGAYIYYPRSNLVVGDMGCFKADSYYALQGMPERGGCEKWLAALTGTEHTGFRLLNAPKEERFCYVRKMLEAGAATSVLVIEINRAELVSAFEEGKKSDESAIGILLNGSPVASAGSTEQLADITDLYEKWRADPKRMLKSKDYFAFFNASSTPGLDFVTTYSSQGLLKTVFVAFTVCGAGTVFCIIFGIAGSVYISRKNSRPMEKLLSSLGAQSSASMDEYQFIMNRFEQMTAEKYKSEELLQRHQTLLNGLFLGTVLRGGLSSENAIFAMAKRYEVNFEAPMYQVLVLASKGRDIPDSAPESGSLQETLTSLAHGGIATSYGGCYVILLNTEEPVPEKQIDQLLHTLQRQIFPNCPSYAGVGPCCDSMAAISNSYCCALKALGGAKSSAHKYGVSHYTPQLEQGVYGDPGVMQEFSSCIYEKQFEQARLLVGRLYAEYLHSTDPAAGTLRRNAVDNLLVDALRTALPAEYAAGETSALTVPGSPISHRRQIAHVLSVLEQAANPAIMEKTPVAMRAKQIIDEKFDDPMMGLYLVSEELKVSNSYLSTTFKNTYGINIIQYINRLRIDKAKSLILNTEMNIKEIAQNVGFASDINFIRVFKKLENQTPTMMRKRWRTDKEPGIWMIP